MTLIARASWFRNSTKCSSVVSTRQGQSVKKPSLGGVNQRRNKIKNKNKLTTKTFELVLAQVLGPRVYGTFGPKAHIIAHL